MIPIKRRCRQGDATEKEMIPSRRQQRQKDDTDRGDDTTPGANTLTHLFLFELGQGHSLLLELLLLHLSLVLQPCIFLADIAFSTPSGIGS